MRMTKFKISYNCFRILSVLSLGSFINDVTLICPFSKPLPFSNLTYLCHKKLSLCYETIMFGRVTHTLGAAAMRVHSFVYVIHILSHHHQLFFDTEREFMQFHYLYIRYSITCVSLIEILATINLY